VLTTIVVTTVRLPVEVGRISAKSVTTKTSQQKQHNVRKIEDIRSAVRCAGKRKIGAICL